MFSLSYINKINDCYAVLRSENSTGLEIIEAVNTCNDYDIPIPFEEIPACNIDCVYDALASRDTEEYRSQ